VRLAGGSCQRADPTRAAPTPTRRRLVSVVRRPPRRRRPVQLRGRAFSTAGARAGARTGTGTGTETGKRPAQRGAATATGAPSPVAPGLSPELRRTCPAPQSRTLPPPDPIDIGEVETMRHGGRRRDLHLSSLISGHDGREGAEAQRRHDNLARARPRTPVSARVWRLAQAWRPARGRPRAGG
jgi:hypothetical protein